MAYSNPSIQTPLITGAGGLVRQFVLPTVGSTSFVTSPAAGATITWLQVPQDGEYSVQLLYGITGGQPFRLNNIRLQVDATTVTSLILLSSATALAATVVLKLTSENWVGLNVISADTAGLTYGGSLLATRMS